MRRLLAFLLRLAERVDDALSAFDNDPEETP